MKKLLIAIALVAGIAGAAVAQDGGTWSVSEAPAKKTVGESILHVIAPSQDYTVVFTQHGISTKLSATNAYRKLDNNESSQVKVTVYHTRKDGVTLHHSAQIATFKDTYTKVTFNLDRAPAMGPPKVAQAPAAAAVQSGPSYIGNITNCSPTNLRVEFLKPGTDVIEKTETVAANKAGPDIKLRGGDYTVRVYQAKGNDYVFDRKTIASFPVSADSWELPYQCNAAGSGVGLVRPGWVFNCMKGETNLIVGIKYTFLREGKVADSFTVHAGKKMKRELLSGEYRVRQQYVRTDLVDKQEHLMPELAAPEVVVKIENRDGWELRPVANICK